MEHCLTAIIFVMIVLKSNHVRYGIHYVDKLLLSKATTYTVYLIDLVEIRRVYGLVSVKLLDGTECKVFYLK